MRRWENVKGVYQNRPRLPIFRYVREHLLSETHSVEQDPVVKSQLASRHQLQSLMWCRFGHVTLKFSSLEDILEPLENAGGSYLHCVVNICARIGCSNLLTVQDMQSYVADQRKL